MHIRRWANNEWIPTSTSISLSCLPSYTHHPHPPHLLRTPRPVIFSTKTTPITTCVQLDQLGRIIKATMPQWDFLTEDRLCVRVCVFCICICEHVCVVVWLRVCACLREFVCVWWIRVGFFFLLASRTIH